MFVKSLLLKTIMHNFAQIFGIKNATMNFGRPYTNFLHCLLRFHPNNLLWRDDLAASGGGDPIADADGDSADGASGG
jgi:hypothetical protein